MIGPVIDEVMMIRPCPLPASAGAAALTVSIVPLTLVAKIASMSCSVMSLSITSGNTPALAHSTSRPPKRSTVSATIRSASAATPTSACT